MGGEGAAGTRSNVLGDGLGLFGRCSGSFAWLGGGWGAGKWFWGVVWDGLGVAPGLLENVFAGLGGHKEAFELCEGILMASWALNTW